MDWKPIETAPRDGTRILFFRPSWAENMGVVFWGENSQEWCSVPNLGFVYGIRYWMPLPAPPAIHAEESK